MIDLSQNLWFRRAMPDPNSRHDYGVCDGDTLDLFIDAGFQQFAAHRIRLLNVDTPELRGPEKAEGQRFRLITHNWMVNAASIAQQNASQWPLIIRTHKSDSFGRYLAEVWNLNGESLNDHLNL